MKKSIRIKWIATASLILMLSCGGQCGSGNNNPVATEGNRVEGGQQIALISSVIPASGSEVRQGETVTIGYTLLPEARSDSVVLYVAGNRVGPLGDSGHPYRISAKHPTGRVQYHITAYEEGREEGRSGEFVVLAASPPVAYGHNVLHIYPHATNAYTQGLLYQGGYLYESTGLNGSSSLRKVDLNSGKVLRSVQLPEAYFGEGLALLNGKLYQLTWQNNKALVYDVETFDKVGEFSYGGEGWGLTTDGQMLYMSDGSERITVVNPEGFRPVRTIEVYTDHSKVMYINELEWINGEIWANVYTSDVIIRIDPATGAVTGVIDMSGLLSSSDITSSTDVFNGIAYDKATGRIFVTGKNWNKLFEIEPVKK